MSLQDKCKQYGKMIEVGQVDYTKKVGIIYNPSSGKKRDVRNEIKSMLDAQKI
jgi:hypothetical protein